MNQKFINGDMVTLLGKKEKKAGIIISSKKSNTHVSKHVENVSNSYPWVYYVLFNGLIEGPFFSTELIRFN
jgi:hypothetical protein